MHLTRAVLHALLGVFFIACNKSNNFKLNINKGIENHDIKIKMKVLGSIPITQIYEGKNQFTIPNGYGENEWYFFYTDSLQGYLRHIKTNQNDQYSYEFSFFKANGKYFVDVNIKGNEPIKKRIELNAKSSKRHFD